MTDWTPGDPTATHRFRRLVNEMLARASADDKESGGGSKIDDITQPEDGPQTIIVGSAPKTAASSSAVTIEVKSRVQASALYKSVNDFPMSSPYKKDSAALVVKSKLHLANCSRIQSLGLGGVTELPYLSVVRSKMGVNIAKLLHRISVLWRTAQEEELDKREFRVLVIVDNSVSTALRMSRNEQIIYQTFAPLFEILSQAEIPFSSEARCTY